MRKILLIAAVLAIVATIVIVLNLRRDVSMLGIDWRIKKSLPVKEVQLQRPKRGLIVQTVTAPGTIELIDEAKIASQTMGQVESVAVEKGDRVKVGDLLVKLDSEDAKARLESTEARIDRLKAAIKSAEADLHKAEAEAEGFENLKQLGFSSETELRDVATVLEKMRAALSMSQHELTESYGMRRNSQQDLERTEIRSPMDGTVIDRDVEKGEVVIAGTTNLPGTVLMTVGDMDRMRVRADVDEADVALIRTSQPAKIFLQADQDDPFPGVVDLIAPKGTKRVDVVSFETLINVSGKHDSLLPEMTATVEIEVNRVEDALGVPVQAVVHRRLRDLPATEVFRDWIARQPQTPAEKGKDEATRYVTVVFLMLNGEARARPVRTGISDQDRIEILEGLGPDDDVIVGPFRVLDEMEEGQPVKLEVAKKSATESGQADKGTVKTTPSGETGPATEAAKKAPAAPSASKTPADAAAKPDSATPAATPEPPPKEPQ